MHKIAVIQLLPNGGILIFAFPLLFLQIWRQRIGGAVVLQGRNFVFCLANILFCKKLAVHKCNVKKKIDNLNKTSWANLYNKTQKKDRKLVVIKYI